jgi:hypothetical protein
MQRTPCAEEPTLAMKHVSLLRTTKRKANDGFAISSACVQAVVKTQRD